MQPQPTTLENHTRIYPLHLPYGQIHIQRDDLLHPIISGNKWRKLAGWLARARVERVDSLVTFGGAFSNHLVATACAAQQQGFRSIGIVRGEETRTNGYLECALGHGMQLFPVSRAVYRDKFAALAAMRASLPDPGSTLVIPEGGCGPEGFLGFAELVAEWRRANFYPRVVFHASATGTTAVGLAKALATADFSTEVAALLVLKNFPEQNAFAQVHGATTGIRWLSGWEHGGYAKVSPELREFTQQISDANNIPFEPIYTGKALWALNEMLKSGDLQAEGTCFLHTGGVLKVEGNTQ